MPQQVWLLNWLVQPYVRASFPAGQLEHFWCRSFFWLTVSLEQNSLRQDVEDVFRRLGFGLSGNASFTVSVPRRRWDITIEADLFEEIARIYGYDKLPATLPKMTGQQVNWQRLKVRASSDYAEGAGLTEIITYALTTLKKQWSSRLHQAA